MSGDPMCAFRAGSRWCINDPCPNPNHRTPDPATGGIVPPPQAPAKPSSPAVVLRQRRQPHCGHGTVVDRYGDQAPDCLYCIEGIDPDDYWDMVRFVNGIHRDQRRKQNRTKK
jgi:hypothetical protein